VHLIHTLIIRSLNRREFSVFPIYAKNICNLRIVDQNIHRHPVGDDALGEGPDRVQVRQIEAA
jgi:hypothetical protein